MLRNAILAVFVALLLCAAAAVAVDPASWPAAVVIALLFAAIALERRRYVDRVAPGPREPLSPTRERFVDPETGRRVQVWANARGERHYVEEPAAGE